MIAKVAIAIVGFVALFPHIQTLGYRIFFNAFVVAGLSGLIGTATRLEPASMIPVNFGYAAAVSVPVTIALHFAVQAFRDTRQALRTKRAV